MKRTREGQLWLREGGRPGALGLFFPPMTLAGHLTLALVCSFGQRDGNTLPGDCNSHCEVTTRCSRIRKAVLTVTCHLNASSPLHTGKSLKIR